MLGFLPDFWRGRSGRCLFSNFTRMPLRYIHPHLKRNQLDAALYLHRQGVVPGGRGADFAAAGLRHGFALKLNDYRAVHLPDQIGAFAACYRGRIGFKIYLYRALRQQRWGGCGRPWLWWRGANRGGGWPGWMFDGVFGHCVDHGWLPVEGQCGILRLRFMGCGAGLKGRGCRGRRVAFSEDDLL